MTLSLKKQLTILSAAAVLSGALLWNGGALRAQDNDTHATRTLMGIKTPRIKLSRDEAAKNFLALLQFFDPLTRENFAFHEPDAAMMSSFSRKSENDSLSPLLLRMAAQLKQPDQTVKVQSEDAQTATVIVETTPAPASRPLILIKEGDSWGVDVVETYAKWNGLEGAAKTEAIAHLATEFTEARETARRASCQSNLKQIALGIAMYAQDWDEKMPPAKPWVDVLQPYLKNEQLFKCPSVTDPKGWGYAYNSKLSSKSDRYIIEPWKVVSVYETSTLKRNAYGVGENRAFRHQGGANYAFADGHVKWLAKTAIPSFNLRP